MTLEEIVQKLLSRKPLPPLSPNRIWDVELNNAIATLKVKPIVKAGLHILNDNLDDSHSIAQKEASAEGKYWHAILHRREGDFSNSKYWYRQMGIHPVFLKMKEKYGDWTPTDFVDDCKNNKVPNLKEIQFDEMKFLLERLL